MTENNSQGPGGGAAENGSIDTVLSSIRRLLKEGKEAHAAANAADAADAARKDAEAQQPPAPAPEPPKAEAPAPEPQHAAPEPESTPEDDDDDSVLVLDSSMMAPAEDLKPEPVPEQIPEETDAPEPPATITPPEQHAAPEKPAEPVPAPEAPPAVQEPPAPALVAPPAEPEHKPEETVAPAHAETGETPASPVQVPVTPTVAPSEKRWRKQLTEPGVTMSEDTDLPESYPAPYTGSSKASDTDAPVPVQIPLDKQTIGATEHSFGVLQQMLRRQQSLQHRERRVAITRGGNLTIEDIVRDEVRAFLKEWLDQHLSGIVQQAVQKEIERLSDR